MQQPGPVFVFRAMRVAEDGAPEIGPSSSKLGVRLDWDISTDPDTGLVVPGTGGMSVSPDDPANLPLHLLPRLLGGQGSHPVWRLRITELGSDLRYRPDPRRSRVHGYIEPARPMPFGEFQRALAGTRLAWVRVFP